jgi:SSS family solute:Na+ symporter
MEMQIPALIIIFVFTFIPLWIGELSRRASLNNVEDFFVQGRRMPTVVLFLTVYATWWSSFAFLGSTSYFYTKGPIYLTAIAWNILFGVLFYLIGKRIWHYGKAHKYITPTDFFDDIYGSKLLNIIITIIMMIFTILYLQIQLSGGAYLIEVASGGIIPWRVSGLVFYLVIIIYLWAGGLRAVAWADIFYSILIFAGLVIGGLYLSYQAGGISYLFQQVYVNDPSYLKLPGPSGNSGILLWFCMFLMTPIGALMGPQLWIRMYAAESGKAFNIMPFLLTLMTIAYMGAVLSGYSGLLLEPNLSRPDTIFPVLLVKYAPAWLAAFLFCCGAAAALSTANAQIHAISAVYSIDIHKKYIHRDISDRSLVRVGRWAIIIFSVGAYIVLIQTPDLIVQSGLIALSGTAQVFVPVIGALFWNKSNANAAIAGVITGISILIVSTYILHFTASYGGTFGLLVNALVFIILSRFLKENSRVSNKIFAYRKAYEEFQASDR